MVLAFLGSTIGFQPAIVPVSVANKKTAAFTPSRRNPPVELNTWPVGEPAGTATVMGAPAGAGLPAPSRTVIRFAPLSEIQKGPVGLKEIPHGFTRFLSWRSACAGRSETSPCSR